MSLRHAFSELNGIVNYHVLNLIEICRENARIDVRKCWVDALAMLEANLDSATDTDNLVPPYSERLLEDLDGVTPSFDQWLATERAHFENHVRKILEAELGPLIERNAKPDARGAAARRLINFEPTHEGAARSLMTALSEMGDRPHAIREFERYRQALLTVLDLPPSRETTALYEAIRIESPPVVLEGSASLKPSKTTEDRSLVLPFARWDIEKQSDPAANPVYDLGRGGGVNPQ
jgi:DNA-binding SARP family transcriptional activator